MIIKLNMNQFKYLNDSLSKKKEFLKSSIKLIGTNGPFIMIEVNEETADEIRDWAGETLQEKGFGINYEPTPEGKILEELIDLFYIE